MKEKFALGLDVGGTNARAAVVDARGRILASHKLPLTDRAPEAVALVLGTCAREALRQAQLSIEDCAGAGAGVAGQIDAQTDRILVAPNLGWRDVEFRPVLSKALGTSVSLGNDLSVAALGESRAGAARGYDSAVLVFVGSGVGSGLVLNGRLYTGATGVAGEVGHVKVRPGGRLCGCGERGCLEAYAGGHNLGRRAAEAMTDGRTTRLQVPEGLAPTARMLEAARAAGDALSEELLGDAADLVGGAAADVVTLLNPNVLILGGGVLEGSRWMRERVEDVIRAQTSRTALSPLLIVSPALGDDAGVIGAAFLALPTS